jgi:hypothetical protein
MSVTQVIYPLFMKQNENVEAFEKIKFGKVSYHVEQGHIYRLVYCVIDRKWQWSHCEGLHPPYLRKVRGTGIP